MDLLIDTQALVWLITGERKIATAAYDAIFAPDARLFISAVTAWEFSDLRHRGRLPVEEDIEHIARLFAIAIIDYPADVWRLAEQLPKLHRDPVDRMLIAHAVAADMTLVTADATMRRYPVKTLW